MILQCQIVKAEGFPEADSARGLGYSKGPSRDRPEMPKLLFNFIPDLFNLFQPETHRLYQILADQTGPLLLTARPISHWL
jgi:hypothetical protein